MHAYSYGKKDRDAGLGGGTEVSANMQQQDWLKQSLDVGRGHV